MPQMPRTGLTRSQKELAGLVAAWTRLADDIEDALDDAEEATDG